MTEDQERTLRDMLHQLQHFSWVEDLDETDGSIERIVTYVHDLTDLYLES